MKGEIATRYREFEIPGTAQVVEGNSGLPKVRITTPEANGEIYLHGAHVTSWKPAGAHEVLFLSALSRWQDDRAIRGGDKRIRRCNDLIPWADPCCQTGNMKGRCTGIDR